MAQKTHYDVIISVTGVDEMGVDDSDVFTSCSLLSLEIIITKKVTNAKIEISLLLYN